MVDRDFLKNLADNLNLPCGHINVGGAMVATPYFNYVEKLQNRLEAASVFVQFYKTVGRFITNIMIHWDPIIEGNAIKFKDTGLNIAIATVEGDKGSSGKMNKFKYTAA